MDTRDLTPGHDPHRPAARFAILLGVVLLAAAPVRAQDDPGRHGIRAGLRFGYATVGMSSDQEPHRRRDALAMAFDVGVFADPHVRLGAEIGGWLLESFDPDDPAEGESVSRALAVAMVYPWAGRDWFLEAGAGRATYINEHPLEFGSSGWGWMVGVGRDWSLGRRISLAPGINYSRGGLGDVVNPVATVRNREYGVFDFGIAVTYR